MRFELMPKITTVKNGIKLGNDYKFFHNFVVYYSFHISVDRSNRRTNFP